MHRHRLLLFATLFCAAPIAAWADRVDDFVVETMNRQRVPGLSLAVVRDGKVLKAQGYGFASVEHQVPAKRETIYQSGSVGKQFTATAVMLLVENGKVALDQPIRTYLPSAPESWSKVTVRQLLTHTSGASGFYHEVNLRGDYTEDEQLQLAFNTSLEFTPGEKWQYSNTGYLVLGVLVSKVSGEFYGDFLKKRVFEPLEMKTARIISEADIIANRAAGYRFVNGELKNQEWVSPSVNTTGDGALYLTVDDLIKWDAALYSEKLLKKKSLDEMWTPAKTADGKATNYGFGWFIETLNGHKVIHHGGAWQGFTTCIRRYIDNRLTVIVLTNAAGPDSAGGPGSKPQEIAEGVAAIYEPDIAPPSKKAAAQQNSEAQ